jgi:hypothetical protein
VGVVRPAPRSRGTYVYSQKETIWGFKESLDSRIGDPRLGGHAALQGSRGVASYIQLIIYYSSVQYGMLHTKKMC